MWKSLAPVIVVLGVAERVIGFAGLPGDIAVWHKILSMVPDEVFGAAILATAYFAWKKWGDDAFRITG